MPDALMTELTPMEHSRKHRGQLFFPRFGQDFTQQRARQTTWQHRARRLSPQKKALPFPGSAPVIIVISVYIVNWIAQKAA